MIICSPILTPSTWFDNGNPNLSNKVSWVIYYLYNNGHSRYFYLFYLSALYDYSMQN
jgi:hypothetical protein